MYRAAAARRLLLLASSGSNGGDGLRFPHLQAVGNFRRSSTASSSSESFANQSSNQYQKPQSHPETPNYTDSASSLSTSTSSATQEALRHERQKPRANYEEEQARVLQASLPHVIKLGWSEAALIAGAREVGISPSIIGSFPRKEAVLVEFFMDDCLQRLIDIIDSDKDLRNLILSELISKLVRARLEMQTPYISKWPQALSIQAQPLNVPTSFKQRAMLVDEIWHAAGDEASDIDWYVKRTVLGGIYSTTEVYMLTDNSPDFRDTWAFLDDRVKDAFDLKKTIQEAKYFAEAVGAGMGSSLQGFVKRVFQG